MAIVTLDDMKEHLGVTSSVDDEMIEGKIDAAQSWIETFLGYSIEEEFTGAVPPDLIEAVKQQAAHFYENRESVAAGIAMQLSPASVEDVIRNRRNYTFG